MEGLLIRFFPERHFGFIKHAQGETFVHEFNIFYSPAAKGDRVSFDFGSYNNRPVAVNVHLLGAVEGGEL